MHDARLRRLMRIRTSGKLRSGARVPTASG